MELARVPGRVTRLVAGIAVCNCHARQSFVRYVVCCHTQGSTAALRHKTAVVATLTARRSYHGVVHGVR